MEFIDAKIWIFKNASLCRVFANQVTYYMVTQDNQVTHTKANILKLKMAFLFTSLVAQLLPYSLMLDSRANSLEPHEQIHPYRKVNNIHHL